MIEEADPAQQPDDETSEQPQQQPTGSQLKLSVNELKRISTRIVQDFNNAIPDHKGRMNRFLRYYRMWRDRVGAAGGEQGASNFHVPLVKWQLFARWAKEVDALLGDDAEIVANPTAPTDAGRVRKVGRYMTWRFFNSMRATTPLIIFLFQKLIFGRAFARCDYAQEKYGVPGEGEVVDYDGPRFIPIWPDNIIVPAEDVQSAQDFSFLIERFRATPDDLLDGEGKLYRGITDNWEKIIQASRNTVQRNAQTDQMTREQDQAEGVLRDFSMSAGESLEVWAWYGHWRLLKGKGDGTTDNFKRRQMRESDVVCYYLPDCDLMIGEHDLAVLYPKMRKRRPIVESSLVKDGSYWGPSVPELLEDIELELGANHNIATEAGERSVGPLIFYRPGKGFTPKTLRYEPNLLIPTDNPSDDVNVVTLTPNLQFSALRQQELLDYSERITGVTEQNLGRQNDRPNAPRTLGQTQLFLGESSVRLALDHKVVREDLGLICEHIWNLDSMYAAPQIFFRVTEEQAGGLFDTANGFGKMTTQERNARYDFDLKFATSSHSKEQVKQEKSGIFQAMMIVPIVQQNPVAQWLILDDFLKAYGMSGMGKYMPKPGPTDFPKDPAEEWSLMLEGESVHVNGMDDDNEHLAQHQEQLQTEQQKKDEYRDREAENRLIAHILETQQQIQQKQLQAETAQAMGGALAGLAGGAAGIAGGGGTGQPGGLDLMSIIQGGLLQKNGIGG
jgi:hypothetical protein